MEPLVIAEGSKHQIQVLDVREDYPWARQSVWNPERPPKCLFIHHTASGRRVRTMREEGEAMIDLARVAPYGLPYNFLAWPTGSQRIYYLRDVDAGWPHTIGHNDCVAVCAWGNYQQVDPPVRMVQRMRRLCLALMDMWGVPLPVLAHRHVAGTACPGDRLFDQLARRHLWDGGEAWMRGEW